MEAGEVVSVSSALYAHRPSLSVFYPTPRAGTTCPGQHQTSRPAWQSACPGAAETNRRPRGDRLDPACLSSAPASHRPQAKAREQEDDMAGLQARGWHGAAWMLHAWGSLHATCYMHAGATADLGQTPGGW
jgi:hypothetical protein